MKKRYYLFIGGFILFLIFFVVDTNITMQKVKENTTYIDSLNVSLAGKIISLKKLGRGSGLVLVEVDTSNYEEFDNRSRIEYFLIIKNKKAEIYLPNTDKIQINDILSINKRDIKLYRGNDLILNLENGIGLTPKPNLSTSTFYKKIRNAHTL